VSGRPTAAIGIDVGGTKTAVAMVETDDGQVLGVRQIDTVSRAGAAQLHDRLAPQLAELVASVDVELVGVGVGVPELVNPDGLVVTEVVVPGLGGDLVEQWADLGVTAVEADVRAAAVAESRLGAGASRASFVYVSVGTGISHCLVVDGVPWAGANGAAILLGSGVLADRASLGGPIGTPALEEYASGPGIVARYQEMGGVASSASEVVARCALDDTAREVVSGAGRALGLGLAELVNLLDPHAVVVGGGLGSAPGLYWESAVAAARPAIWAEVARGVTVVQSAVGPLAGAIGAALISLVRT